MRKKLLLTFCATTLIILFMNLYMYRNINRFIRQANTIYESNLSLNELKTSLNQVQTSMRYYLDTKTSDAMEDYYRNEQKYNHMIQELDTTISSNPLLLMERNIYYMSQEYLNLTNQTVEAKRGRNVNKYKTRYDKASELYDYLSTNIYTLNDAQFKVNSINNEALSKSMKSLESVSTFLLVGIGFGNLVLIIILTGAIVKPLKMLARTANQVAQGDFMVDLVDNQNRDEVGVVTRAFDKMVVSIRQYIEKLTQSMENERSLRERELTMEAGLKDAQLKYLQAQINPHFLFNTLNAGAQLAMLEDAERTGRYIQNVADFYRYNLKTDSETVTLREEIQLVDTYIYILNVRFSGEIAFEKNVDESLIGYKIPSMILQPIVENSFTYGIRNLEGNGKINLSIYQTQDSIEVSIKDNGTGMSQEIIDSILAGFPKKKDKQKESNGIGLRNVIKRLQMYFEYEEIISIMSEGEGMGTEVVFHLPMKKA